MKYFLPILSSLLLIACAQQTSPTGGPKDEDPPELISSNPANGDINVKGSQLELTFSELVQLDKAKEQIIISPSVKEVESTYRKNKVFLIFKTPLADSTTYSINFREAVKDLTERNPAQNLKLAFSTGPYLDSLSISGNVFDLLSSKPAADITVALHTENDTFNIFKHKAELFTKADAQGNFNIENLKSTTFYIYAFHDKNKNLIVDGRNEKYGFLSTKILLTENVGNLMLPLVSLDSRSIRLISARPLQNYFLIKTNKGIKDYSITLPDHRPTTFTRGEDNASIKLYKTFEVKDSTQARLQFADSLGNKIDTTLYVNFNPPKEDLKLDKFTVKYEKPIILEKSDRLQLTLQYNKPILSINYDSIYFIIDSLTRFPLKPEEIKMDTLNQRLQITKTLPKVKGEAVESEVNKLSKEEKSDRPKTQEKINELRLGRGAFLSIDLDSSAYQSQKPTIMKEEDLAITLVETNSTSKSFYIEIINSQGKVVQTVRKQSKFSFTDIEPGEYELKLIIDHNDNGKWDAGNYYKREEPEPIYYYFDDKGNTKFNLKANWEYGPLLIKEEYPVNNLGKTVKK